MLSYRKSRNVSNKTTAAMTSNGLPVSPPVEWEIYFPTVDITSYNLLLTASKLRDMVREADELTFETCASYVSVLTSIAIEIERQRGEVKSPVALPMFAGSRCMAAVSSQTPYLEIVAASIDLAGIALLQARRFLRDNACLGGPARTLESLFDYSQVLYECQLNADTVVRRLRASAQQLLLLNQVVFSVWKNGIDREIAPYVLCSTAHILLFVARVVAVVAPPPSVIVSRSQRLSMTHRAYEALAFYSRYAHDSISSQAMVLAKQIGFVLYLEMADHFQHKEFTFEDAVWALFRAKEVARGETAECLSEIDARIDEMRAARARGMYTGDIGDGETPIAWDIQFPRGEWNVDVVNNPPRCSLFPAIPASRSDFHELKIVYTNSDRNEYSQFD